MKVLKPLVFTFLIVLMLGCNRRGIIYIYSLDKSQKVTVINENGVRYIIDGKHNEVPKLNYIKLDVRKIDPLGDALQICWKNKYEWEAVVHGSIVLEAKIDTSKFNFSNTLPLDERGIPTQKKYVQDGCAVFDFHTMKLIPDKGAIVEIR